MPWPLAGAVTLSLYHVIGRGLRDALPLSAYVLGVWSTAAATLAVLAASARVPVFGYPPRTFALFLALAVVPTVIGHGLVNRSLRHIPAPTVGLFLLGEPIAASILAYAVFGEMPGALTLAGGVLVLAALALVVQSEGAMTARHHVHVLFTGGTISMRVDPGTGAAVPAMSGEEIVARVHGLRKEARLTLEDYARLPGPHVTPHWMWRLRGRVADAPRRSRGGRRRPHPRDGHPRGDGLPPRPDPREREARRVLRRHAHGVRSGLGRPREPDDGGAHGGPSRGARPRRPGGGRASRSWPRPRPRSGTPRASPPSAARAGRSPSWIAARSSSSGRPSAPRRSRRGGSCPTSTCTRWRRASTTRCCARPSPAARAAWSSRRRARQRAARLPSRPARGSRRAPAGGPRVALRGRPRRPCLRLRRRRPDARELGVIFGQDLPGPKARIKLMVALGRRRTWGASGRCSNRAPTAS